MDFVELTEFLTKAEDIAQLEVRLRALSLEDLHGVTAREMAGATATVLEGLHQYHPRGGGTPQRMMTALSKNKRYGRHA